jgi:hypothetical protein
MFRRVSVVAAAAGLFVLSACTQGQQGPQAGSAVPQAGGPSHSSAIMPAKDCGGTGGVKVTPCPVRLTRHTKPGIVVTVSGPGVVNSYLGKINGCFSGHLCYNLEREGSSETQWRITSGPYCGRADVEFDGVNASGQRVGYFFLGLRNRYCR